MPLTLLQTKLYIPVLRAQYVARPAVTAKLQRDTTVPLTLVAAPAGFGKTTLVSEWTAQRDQPVAWLSLDDEDNDPSRFFTYLVAALRTLYPQLGDATLAALHALQLPPPIALLTPLINELSQLVEPFTLVLDDYHLITAQPIHDALTFLVEHGPPALHLILTTRIDPPLPLARWRVRGLLTEVRADDLRFRTEEVTDFFHQVMGLPLTRRDLATLATRTEGWIAGLQLAALSLQGRADTASFIQSFSGSHRHVFSYLLEEVLNRRPTGTLTFLLQTAVLERFTADLCNRVTGSRDSQSVLEKIDQANLFLISLDDERKWYRYHHLFAEMLRNHLQQSEPQLIPALHERAASWFAVQELWPEAIHHALAATDFATAAQMIEQVGIARFAQSNIQHSLQRWLAALPPAFVDARPHLCLLHAWMRFAHLDMPGGLQWVAKAEAAGATGGAPEGQMGEAAAMRALLSAYSASIDPHDVLTCGRTALAALPPDQHAFRGIAAAAMAMAHLKLGDVVAAEANMAEAKRMSQIVANFYMFVSVASNQAAMQRAQGLLHRALTTCHESMAWLVAQGAQAFPTFSALHLNLADLLREQNELTVAEQHAQTAIAHSEQEISPVMLLLSRVGLMRIKQAQGDWPAVWRLLAEITALAEQRPMVIHRSVLPALRAQYQVAVVTATDGGDDALDVAWQWAQTTRWEEGKLLSAYRFSDFIYLYEHSRLARVQVYMAWARRTKDRDLLRETLAYLHGQAHLAAENHLGWYFLKVQLLEALVYHALGDRARTIALLTAVLQRAVKDGYVRIFVDEGEPMRRLLLDFCAHNEQRVAHIHGAALATYVDNLLAAFPQGQQADNPDGLLPLHPTPTLIESLSEREHEILQLVADGLSNSQLAEELIVTVGTVKKHLNNIYGKLGVASRTQAIARGREVGLLAD